ncbi:MAG: glycosyltransferase family 4 protein [Bacteroidales bacterium]
MNISMLLDNEFKADPRVNNEAMMLAKAGHQVHIICLNFGKQKPFEQKGNIYIHRLFIPEKIKKTIFLLQFIVPLFQWFWFLKSRNIIRKYKIGAIHAHDLYMARPALMLKRFLHLSVILDLHENYPAALDAYTWAHKFPARWIYKAEWWINIEFRLLSGADAIIVLSRTYKDTLRSKYPSLSNEKFFIYPNVPVLQEFNKYPTYNGHYEFMKEGFWMVYFGVIGKRRGILDVLRALRIADNPSIHLLLVGPIDKHDKEEFSIELEYFSQSKQVVYFPWKDISELPSMLYYAHLALSPLVKNPQHESGVANKVFQYMLMGKALLVSDCEPQVELVEEFGCGLSFEASNLDDLVGKITWAYDNQEKLDEMGARGRRAVLEKYNSDYQYQPLLDFYNRISLHG